MDLNINQANKIAIPKGERVGDFVYLAGKLYFDLPHPKPCTLSADFKRGEIEYTPYFKKLPTIFRGGINLEFVIKNIMFLKYLDEGKLMMHGAVINNDLLAGYPNCGKTTLCVHAARDNMPIMTDEYSVIEKEFLIASRPPRFTRSFMNEKQLSDLGLVVAGKDGWKYKYSKLRARIFPWLFEEGMFFEFQDVFKGHTVEISQIKHIGIIERDKIDTENLFRKLSAILMNEFNFMGDPVLNALYYMGDIDLKEYARKQDQLIYNLIERTQ